MSYSKAWKKYKKGYYTLIELLVVLAIITIFLVLVVGGIAIAIGSCSVVKNIKEDGLKSSVEEVWEGPAKTEQTLPEEVDNQE